VNDINDTYIRLISVGATENEPPYSVGGDLMTATVKDPFGNVIGLIYNPHFKIKA
jgi:lactoylglutathione lyase